MKEIVEQVTRLPDFLLGFRIESETWRADAGAAARVDALVLVLEVDAQRVDMRGGDAVEGPKFVTFGTFHAVVPTCCRRTGGGDDVQEVEVIGLEARKRKRHLRVVGRQWLREGGAGPDHVRAVATRERDGACGRDVHGERKRAGRGKRDLRPSGERHAAAAQDDCLAGGRGCEDVRDVAASVAGDDDRAASK